MSKELRLSICVVTYNHEKYIAQALDSFLMQETDFAFQVIVGDDCSTDNTPNIIRQYALKYPDIIKPILREKNVGAINNSLDVYDNAKTEYVAICDGDDYWTDSKKLQKQVDFLDKNKSFSTCFHLTSIVYENGYKSNIYPSKSVIKGRRNFTLEELAFENPMHTNTVVYRWRFTSESIKEAMPNNICPGDYFLALLHAELGKIHFIDELMSVYRKHSGGMSDDLSYGDDGLWLKYGFMELNFFNAIDRHFSYSLSEIMRNKKVERSFQILNSFIRNNATDKLEILKRDYPEYYHLGMKYFFLNSENERKDINSNIQNGNKRILKRIRKNSYIVIALVLIDILANLLIK